MNWQDINRRRLPFIQVGERMFGRMYADMRRELIREILKYEQVGQIDHILQNFRSGVNFMDTFESYYVRAGSAFAKITIAEHKGSGVQFETKDIDIWEAKIRDYVRTKTGKLITDAMQRHYREIVAISKTVVEQALTQGWGIEQAARAISKEIGMQDVWKARRIARTEAVRACNYGIKVGADDLPGSKQKQWITTRDGRERDDHKDMDEVTVDYNDVFIVGGEPMEMPGDPSAPPEQTINCRCGWGVIIKSDIYE